MAKKLLHINDVTPLSSSWSVKVIVESRPPSQTSIHGSTTFQQITLADELGTRIVATLFGRDIDEYQNTLILYDTYIVSNAKVSPADPRYDSLGNKYTWIFSRRTVVTKVLDDVIPRSVIIPNFHDFQSLQPSDDKKNVDIIAIVIKKYDARTVTSSGKTYVVHEFALLNDEKRPIMLTLWNSVAVAVGHMLMNATEQMPIITATRLVVSNHYGVSLGSTFLTSIVVDPPIPEVQKLKTWRANNRQAINDALTEIDAIIKMQLSTVQAGAKFHTVSDVARSENAEKFTLKANLQLSDTMQQFYYIACAKCNASYDAELNWEFDCRKCNQKTIGEPREKVFVNVEDDSGCIEATAFGDDAIKIMNMNAVAAVEMSTSEITPSIHKMNQALRNRKFIVKLKKTFFLRKDGTHVQYTIQRIIDDKEKEIATPTSAVIPAIHTKEKEPQQCKTDSRKRLTFSDDHNIPGTSVELKKIKEVVQEHHEIAPTTLEEN